jgi:hypothetical protein
VPSLITVHGLLRYGLEPDAIVALVCAEESCTRRQAVRVVEAALCRFPTRLVAAVQRLPLR